MLEFLFLHPYPRLSGLSGIPPRTGRSLSMGQPVPQPGSVPWVQALPERWNQPGTPCHSCAIVPSQCFESNFPDNTISPQEQGSCAFLGSPGPCVLWVPWMCKTYDKAPSFACSIASERTVPPSLCLQQLRWSARIQKVLSHLS